MFANGCECEYLNTSKSKRVADGRIECIKQMRNIYLSGNNDCNLVCAADVNNEKGIVT